MKTLFSDIGDAKAAEKLRSTLDNQQRLVLLASTTGKFRELDDSIRCGDVPLRAIKLRPFDLDQCVQLWSIVTGKSATKTEVRPIQILTGGNPRLMTKIATYSAGKSFQQLIENLLGLVDDHTEYFKQRLEHLPTHERRVYLALARLWKPATTSEIATLARTNTSRTSALLSRLSNRGLVAFTPEKSSNDGARRYYLTERLYNIYYLFRRGSGSEAAVEALIDFMKHWYAPPRLQNATNQILLPTLDNPKSTQDIWEPVVASFNNESHPSAENEALETELKAFKESARKCAEINSTESRMLRIVAMDRMAFLLHWLLRDEKSIRICEEIVYEVDSHEPIHHPNLFFWLRHKASALMCKGNALTAQNHNQLATEVYGEALEIFGRLVRAEADPAAFIASSIYGWYGIPSGDPDGPLQDVYTKMKQAHENVNMKDWFANSGSANELYFQVAFASFGKSLAHLKIGETAEATAELDSIIEDTNLDAGRRTMKIATNARAIKFMMTPRNGNGAVGYELNSLLAIVARSGVTDLALEALVESVRRSAPNTVLGSIQAAGATEVLLPFITALQMETEQKPIVPKEVDEVAADIRARFAERSNEIIFDSHREGDKSLR